MPPRKAGGAVEVEGWGLVSEEAEQQSEFYFAQFPWDGSEQVLEELLPEAFFALLE